MRIKDFLNEFEADRAALPGVEKETLAKLRNKTIVISGGELARCLCYAFLYNNEAKRLGIKVILLGKSRNAMASYHSELLLRDDFDFVDYNSASEISSADYVITTGICGEHTDNNPQIMIDGIADKCLCQNCKSHRRKSCCCERQQNLRQSQTAQSLFRKRVRRT